MLAAQCRQEYIDIFLIAPESGSTARRKQRGYDAGLRQVTVIAHGARMSPGSVSARMLPWDALGQGIAAPLADGDGQRPPSLLRVPVECQSKVLEHPRRPTLRRATDWRERAPLWQIRHLPVQRLQGWPLGGLGERGARGQAAGARGAGAGAKCVARLRHLRRQRLRGR